MTSPRTVLNEFYHLCVEARFDFDLYQSLFETDVKATEFCMNYAPHFFYDINRIVTHALILQLCKLTDPAGSGSKMNLTTNYILDKLPWPPRVKADLTHFNNLLMNFRAKIEQARSKRIAHTDLHSQVERLDAMGKFNRGEDSQFFLDLQSFFDVAHRHVFGASTRPIAAGMSTDTYKVVRAIEKATLFDRCHRCTEKQRNTDLLNFDQGD